MSPEQIKQFIINTLMQRGHGRSAAELQVSPITEALVAAAFRNGWDEGMVAN